MLLVKNLAVINCNANHSCQYLLLVCSEYHCWNDPVQNNEHSSLLQGYMFFYPFGHFKASKIGNIFSMLTKLCFPCSSLFFIDYSRYNALIFLFLCLALNQILSQPPDGWRIFGNVYSMMTTFVFQLDLFHFCHRHCSCPSCHTLFLARATEGTSL